MATNANLVDLVHTNDSVKTFDTVEELSAYTRRTGKIFPRGDVKAGDLLRYLLRHIFNPELDRERHSGGGRNGRKGVAKSGS